mgnify:CR=1 FL=1
MTVGHANARQKSLLSMDIGLPGSGAVRYGAAMYFYQRGDITAELLEIYRCCCKLDNEDPLDLARFEGVVSA